MQVNIALLEDEADERAHTESMLERFFSEAGIDYKVTHFADAQSFLSRGNGFKDFQLLLMDIILPESKQNGIDLAREVRKVNRDVAIMFITKTVQFRRFCPETKKGDALYSAAYRKIHRSQHQGRHRAHRRKQNILYRGNASLSDSAY